MEAPDSGVAEHQSNLLGPEKDEPNSPKIVSTKFSTGVVLPWGTKGNVDFGSNHDAVQTAIAKNLPMILSIVRIVFFIVLMIAAAFLIWVIKS